MLFLVCRQKELCKQSEKGVRQFGLAEQLKIAVQVKYRIFVQISAISFTYFHMLEHRLPKEWNT